MIQPKDTRYYVKVGGFIHAPKWYLHETPFPAGADKKIDLRISAGQFTDWFDLKAFAGTNLHASVVYPVGTDTENAAQRATGRILEA